MPSNTEWLKWRCDRCHSVTCACGLVPTVPTVPTVEGYDPNRRTTLHLTDEALDRIRALEAQRDDLLAALGGVLSTGGVTGGVWRTELFVNSPELIRSRAAIARAKGGDNKSPNPQQRADVLAVHTTLANARPWIRKAKGQA